jgi:glycosyltransferase involved in cell wall biosynthesis
VYAGSLEPGRRPLATWSEVVDGLPVRWISVARFTGWSDRHNFDNPAVVSDFTAHLTEVRPDVVHLHSLQTLGGGMIRAAKEAGATTVVTMHDFWWSCARQFLVDRTWVPCSVVVAAGECHCEVDRPWHDQRAAWLRAQLAFADLVLAPSPVAAEVMAANGVPADRLRVDENGLSERPVGGARPPRAVGAPVRFRYAGGANRMKGSGVLIEAARRLAHDHPSGWELVAHAEQSDLHEEVPGPFPAAVQVAPPFAPADLDAVMGATDVMVLPSLMRESHSLLTREALLRGVPVITSDSLGPEDAVVPGGNGLVVPTGDEAALAAAMATVVADPRVLERWSVAATAVPVRSVQEQLDGLDALLRALLERPPPARAGSRIERVLFVVGIDGAPLRYRAHLPAEALALRGVDSDVRYYRDPEVADLAARADAIVVYRVPATAQVLELIERTKRDQPAVPLLFDVDDLIFDPELADEIPAIKVLPADEAELWLQGVRRYRTTMEACDAYIGSTEQLVRHAAAVTGLPAYRFANGVGLITARRSDRAGRRPRTPGPLRVGYLSGTTTHDRDWAQVEAAVLDVLHELDGVELWLGGHLTPSPAVERLGPRLRRLPMQDWRALPEVLRDLDVNLAPLEPLGRFNEAKSAIKWLEAALCGVPTIASPTEPFVEAIHHGVNGLLAGSSEEWAGALRRLLTDDVARSSMGARARRDALLGWSPHRQADRYLAILEAARTAVAGGRVPRPSSFAPVVLDEPAQLSPLDPYGDDTSPSPAPVGPGRRDRALGAVRSRVRAVGRATRQDGPRRAAAAAGKALVRDLVRVGRAAVRRLSDRG